MRLFLELCGSSFSSYLAFSRVQNLAQVQEQYLNLQDNLQQVDSFLSAYSSTASLSNSNDRPFTMAEAHLAPFVQRCNGMLPPPYDPVSITSDLGLVAARAWIEFILQRKSVLASAPDDLDRKRQMLVKRLARIKSRPV